MDVEIATVLRKKPTVHPKETLKDLEKMKLGRIRKDDWSVAFQILERAYSDFHRVCVFVPNKHLYSTQCLEYILELINQCKVNSVGDKKCFIDMIKWYILVHKTPLGIILKLFIVQKR
ncbi:unnamed protein product [Lactuca saligna]|uniref:Uncharacterized protein n=1 Tax=Lactuca saligna TaxID=75948 RepID=A0AA35Z1R0_LACSI|nr:unnamed protein product [Lactuca saligna]